MMWDVVEDLGYFHKEVDKVIFLEGIFEKQRERQHLNVAINYDYNWKLYQKCFFTFQIWEEGLKKLLL